MRPAFYKSLDECPVNSEEFELCPVCNTKPHLWIFDNGEFAKCLCGGTYDKAHAQGMTIWEFHKLHNGDMTLWNHNDLRDNWNLHVARLKQNI